MPHIKVKPFDLNKLNQLASNSNQFTFYATDIDSSVNMIGIEQDKEKFMLEIKKKDRQYIIKPDPLSRPLDNNKIKQSLKDISEILELDVVYSNIEINPRKPKLADKYHKKISDFENPEFTRKKVIIEIGFGSGRHLLYQAKNNPNTLFIGIEIHTPSLQQLLRQVALQQIDNIWVVNYDARLFLEMMPSNSCAQIFVHFPVPWDKKPHRRVVNDKFLDESLRILKVDGKLELRTDSINYYRHVLEIFSKPQKIDLKVEKNRDIAILSKYEHRWRAQQKDIYTVTVYANEDSPPIKRNYDFSFKVDHNLSSMPNAPYKTLVFDDYFVHFEKKYLIQKKGGAIMRCSFGNFDKPEHRYLIQIGDEINYYPNEPVKTKSNYLAHKKIGELIYG